MVAAVAKALTAMGRSKDIGNIIPYEPNYAKVRDPSKFDTTGWSDSKSIHGQARETSIPGYHNVTLKYYNDPHRGHIIAIVPPTWTPEHFILTPASFFDFPVNTPIAEQFLNPRANH